MAKSRSLKELIQNNKSTAPAEVVGARNFAVDSAPPPPLTLISLPEVEPGSIAGVKSLLSRGSSKKSKKSKEAKPKAKKPSAVSNQTAKKFSGAVGGPQGPSIGTGVVRADDSLVADVRKLKKGEQAFTMTKIEREASDIMMNGGVQSELHAPGGVDGRSADTLIGTVFEARDGTGRRVKIPAGRKLPRKAVKKKSEL